MHFNARSVRNKFNQVSAEIEQLQPSIACISETWLDDNINDSYRINYYSSYYCNRKVKRGGGTMIFVSSSIPSRQCANIVAANDSYNICAVSVGRRNSKTLIVVVYRAPWATVDDTENMCNQLEHIIIKHNKTVIVGDFNVPGAQWSPGWTMISGPCGLLQQFACDHDLTQIARQPTRHSSLLDLVFVLSHYTQSTITDLAPIGDSDHSRQLLHLPITSTVSNTNMSTVVDYDMLSSLLQTVDWSVTFSGCESADDYAEQFTSVLRAAIDESTHFKLRCRRQRLPRHIVTLLRIKQKAWITSRRTGDRIPFVTARRTAKAAIRAYTRNIEQRLIYAGDKSAFYSYVSRKTGKPKQSVSICVKDDLVSDKEAADIFSHEFSKNYSAPTNVQVPVVTEPMMDSDASPTFNCSEGAVLEALKACSNSSSSPDGISYRLLKYIAGSILRPLNIVFQHALNDGIFPRVWKHAIVVPLYKGRGDRSAASSYRPISMCSCIGKLLEKIVHVQLISFLNTHGNLHPAQHGFTAGKSTVTNLLQFDTCIADYLDAGHAYDVIMFDFCKAFDKAPHQCVVDAAAHLGICGMALKWISSFITGRTQQVKVGESLSCTSDAISGVIQGSILGPVLFIMLTNSLLHLIKLPLGGFADDLKFAADVVIYSQPEVQQEIDKLATWASAHLMPISSEKSVAMHCGKRQPKHVYTLNGKPMATVDTTVDLGIVKTSDAKYTEQCHAVASKATRSVFAIRRAFQCRAKELLWPAYQTYVLPIVMYCSAVWNPAMKSNIDIVERVQRKVTKIINGLENKTYHERLQALGTLTLQDKRLISDMTVIYKCLHGLMNCPPSTLGLSVVTANVRGQGVHVTQRRMPKGMSRVCDSLFPHRAPPNWNKLPLSITSCQSLSLFKKQLINYCLFKQIN